ncbi:MAG: DinB family protein [Chitinophagaceae bacterium]|nr:MAG: DinB family protein [Chitinophagaceae bacterium]
MLLREPIVTLFRQVQDSLLQLTDQQYTTSCKVLSNGTVGQHVRHIIEFFMELEKGYVSGTVDYDGRKRDHRIESNREFAMQEMERVIHNLGRPDKQLLLTALLMPEGHEPLRLVTNYYRELLYNLEHMVHHMAFIRTGISSVSDLHLPEGYGVAQSTLQARKVCAQ